MEFLPTKIAGVFVIEVQPHKDERGFFARTYCEGEFREHGLPEGFDQCSVSFNHRAGTIRGMHYQASPARESKLVRCTRGALVDVIVDLREGSATYLEHLAVHLDADNRRGIYVPEGCAHGFQTLSDETEVFYQIQGRYSPEHARGVRFDDPLLGISWPLPVTVVSERDRDWALIKDKGEVR